MVDWQKRYMQKLVASRDEWSYTRSVTILQELYREIWSDVHGEPYAHIEWQAIVPGHYLNTKGLATASSWLRQRIGELTYPTIFAGLPS